MFSVLYPVLYVGRNLQWAWRSPSVADLRVLSPTPLYYYVSVTGFYYAVSSTLSSCVRA
jgi:hypothetical protein